MGPRLGVAAALAATALATAAAAQEADPSGRYDIDDILHRHPYDPSELPTKEEAQGRPVTLDLSLGGAFSTNAGTSRHDTVATGYLVPGLGIDVTPVAVGGGWDVGAGAKIDADYYTGKYDDRFGEGRLEGFIFAEHALGPGTFGAEFVVHAVFDNEFSDQDFKLLISNVSYSVTSGRFSVEVDAEYEDADIPELRRTRASATVGYDLPQRVLGHSLSVEGSAAFSDFNGGANQNRNDTTVGLVLIAERRFREGWSLEWEAAFVNRFSNRETSRFNSFEVGVELAKRF